MPGRTLGAVLDEADGEGGRRDDDGVGAFDGRDRDMRGRGRKGAEAERGTGAAGGVLLFLGRGLCRTGFRRRVVRLAGMLAVMGMRIGNGSVGRRGRIGQAVAGLRMSARASHAVGRNRMQREHGQQ